MNEIWILGASGRTGREIAALLAQEFPVVLVGRDAAALQAVAAPLGEKARTLVAEDVQAMAKQITANAPAVVVNTMGPFTETAEPIVRACPPGTHYVDLAAELSVATNLLATSSEVARTERTVVVGAGFAVIGTESLVLKMCQDRPTPHRVRVDAMAAYGTGGTLGRAVAASIVDAFVSGGRRYENGRMVRVGLGADTEHITLPEGGTRTTAGLPGAELLAAHRASQAPFVVSASSDAPAGAMARLFLPLVGLMLKPGFMSRFATKQMAKVPLKPPADGKLTTWTRARIEWTDGTVREGWLRAGEVLAFATGMAAEVAGRLARGEGRPGVYTPGQLFGHGIAEKVGARFILD